MRTESPSFPKHPSSPMHDHKSPFPYDEEIFHELMDFSIETKVEHP
jgi:hypothetical protein